jgi:drug/metabolite transporter (DMT)-like permease
MTYRSQTSISPLAWALLVLLALIWGGSFLSNRAAVAHVPVFTVVAFRVGGAALALWAYVLLRHLPMPSRDRLPSLLFIGVTNNVIPFSLIVWGQKHIPSGLAGILNASTAIFTVLLAAAVLPDERLTARKAAGVAIGFAGVVLAIGPAELRALDLTSLGQLAIVAAAAFYAISGIFARRSLTGLRPEVSAAGTLAGAASVMLPLAFWMDGLPTLDYPLSAWLAMGYLALIASAFAYMLFYIVLQRAGAGNLSLVTLMVAPVAMVLGSLAYGEAFRSAEYAGFALLALGLLVVDGRPRWLVRPAAESA